MSDRPNPDRLLRHVQADEQSASQGRLKLFFGASPGVGKTYAMLEASRQRRNEGWDVLAGIVETHGRIETQALLEGLEMLPRKAVQYKGVDLLEFDLDGVLARHPRLVLVDELAHTNAPGLRHAKRWQDVEELLDSGIDVYTTLNVQHWETLNDVVAQITGVIVRETVPDTFLTRAHEVELVDLPPEELLKRLEQGKVYRGQIAGRAAEHFFQPGNLIALRELALRHVAERVDAQMQAFKERHAIDQVWHVAERLLVGVSASPMSARLVRATARIATRLRAEWIVAHVDTAVSLGSASEERSRVAQTLRLAEELGAKAVTLAGDDVTSEILNYARSKNVTKIVLGKPARPLWQEWIQGSVVNKVARQAGDIDLFVISGMGGSFRSRRPALSTAPNVLTGTLWAGTIVAFETLVCRFLLHSFDRTNIAMVYFLGLVWIAYHFGNAPAMVASVLGVLAFDFFFVPPYWSFSVTDTQYLFTFLVMLVVGMVISAVTGRLRAQASALRERGLRTDALYALSRALSESPDPSEVMRIAVQHLSDFYHSPVVLLTPAAQGTLAVAAGDSSEFHLGPHELGTAQWVYDHEQAAGSGTETLAGSSGLYLPLRGIRSTVGVVGIRAGWTSALDPDRQRLLETFAGEIGSALESTRMSEAIGRAEMQMELQAISYPESAAPLRMADFIAEDRILFFSSKITEEEIFRRLVGKLALRNESQILKAILERERTGPTFIGNGVQAPHARIPGLKGLQAALGISSEGAVRVQVLFVGPADETRIHLAFLASIASSFQNEEHVKTLCEQKSPAAVIAFLKTL